MIQTSSFELVPFWLRGCSICDYAGHLIAADDSSQQANGGVRGIVAAGVSHDNQAPVGASNTTKIPRKDPREREERKKIVAGEGNFSPLPGHHFGPNFSGFGGFAFRAPTLANIMFSHHGRWECWERVEGERGETF